MSRLLEYEQQYKWVEDALLEAFPDGVVGTNWSDYNCELMMGIYLTLPNGVSWRKGIYCMKDGEDSLEGMTADEIKSTFRTSYLRACNEQQASGPQLGVPE